VNPERLQKILARAGVASRRQGEEMIRLGRVQVNGAVVREPGTKADAARDEIRVDGRRIPPAEERLYLLMNKPRGYVTTLRDPEGRPTVRDLLIGVTERVFPVGRLDYETEGLLLFTNDGEFSQRLSHPRYRITKTYRVKIQGRMPARDLVALKGGVNLEDGPFQPREVSLDKVNDRSTWLTLTLAEGRNRVIRRALEALGYHVTRLRRTAIGGLKLGTLKEGEIRPLSSREVERLLSLRF
jgi:23S rRNA pseudouridine2605 synthase